jgi:sulfopyruvate decarboxylase subunit beta
MPESIPAPLIIDTLKDTFSEARGGSTKEPLGWILSVPDTHQKTVLAALDKEPALRVVTCATEDEANAIAAGLWIGGEPVVLMIQHAGLYASVNTLRGVAMDGRVPTFYMIGLLQRERDRDPKESRHSMVRFAEPLLDTFGVPHARLEGPDDVHLIPEYYRLSRQRRGPTAVFVGLENSSMAIKPEDVLRAIAAARGDAICVPTMTTSPAWRTIAPDDLSIGCVGFMGGASSLGLGLALSMPRRRVIVFDGDGSLLMQLGSLATIAGARPRNLTHLLFKNGVYHTSGAQDIPGGLSVDFVQMAQGAGYRKAYAVSDFEDFKRRLPVMLTDEGPLFVELHTGLADKTPMTDRGGQPFHQQVESLHQKLHKAG